MAVGGQRPALAPREDPRPHESKHRRQEGERCDHREQHADARGDGEAVEEADPQREHPQQRDADDRAGEQHGAPGRVDGQLNRAPDVAARLQPLSVTGHDEQRVVHADTKADQQHELGGEHRHLHDVADQTDDLDRGPEGNQCGGQRHGHGEQRPEDQEQDDARRDDPQAGAANRWLVRLLSHLTRDRHDDAVAGPLLGGVDELLRVADREVLRLLVEAHARERHRAVRTHLLGTRRVVRRLHRRDVRKLRHLGEHRCDLPLDLGVGHLGAAAGADHDLLRVAGLLRSGCLQQLQGLRGLGIGQREVVRIGGPHRRCDAEHDQERRDPRADHDPPMFERPTSELAHPADPPRDRLGDNQGYEPRPCMPEAGRIVAVGSP